MNHDSPGNEDRNEEERLREVIMTADKNASPPDRDFLDGLKTQSTQRFVEAAAARNSKRSRIMAIIKRNAPRAMAASVLLAAGAAIIMLTSGGEKGWAFADVVKRIEQAQGMKMKITGTASLGPNKMTVEGTIVMGTGGRTRAEMTASGHKMVMINDYAKGAMLTLMPKQKIAIAVQFKDMPKVLRAKMIKQGDQFSQIKKMLGDAQKELGVKTIDGVKVKGYRSVNEIMAMDIWVNAKTGTPVQIALEMVEDGTKLVMSDIEILDKVDPALFSLEAPKGYTVQKQQAISMKPAGVKELTELFKAWGEITDGQFPDFLRPGLFATLAKDHAMKLVEAGSADKGLQAGTSRVGLTASTRLTNAIVLKQLNKTFHYQGQGVKLGDKATPVLWYKPEGKDKYVVMYGDLHVERVAEKDLPAKRKAAATKPAAPGPK